MRGESESGVPIPGFYLWEVPAKSISVQLSLEVVDRLQQDVMRGFGAVPRRGAEVGGILLGAVAGSGPSVRVVDYELVPIEYKRGPSYRLSEDDRQAFQAAVQRVRNGTVPVPVGYFRSHTRDGAGLCDQDRELLANYFPQPETIALLIRPFATKPSVAGFYFKEAGIFPSGPPLREFPFSRKYLAPGDAQELESGRAGRASQEMSQRMPESRTLPAETRQIAVPTGRRKIPVLPMLLLLVGALLGYLASITLQPRSTAPFRLALTVAQSVNGIQLRWDEQSQAIRSAKRGSLTIEDGAFSKTADLTAAELQSGSAATYRPVTKHVHFRLEIFPSDRTSISETTDWRIP